MIAPKHLCLLIACFVGTLEVSTAASQKTEVSAREYCAFLNRMPDAAALYEEKMAATGSILREGTPGSYTYIVSEEESNAVTYVDQISATYYQTGYPVEEMLPRFQTESIDPYLKSNHFTLSDILETDDLINTKSGKKKAKKDILFPTATAAGALLAVAFLTTADQRRGSPELESHAEGESTTGDGASINTSPPRRPSGYNGAVQVLPSSAGSPPLQLPETLPPEEQGIHDVGTGQSVVVQIPPIPKPVPSSQVMAIQAAIAERPKGVSFALPPEAEHTDGSSTQRLEKHSALGSKQLKRLITGIEIAIDTIPEEASDRAAQVAAIYANAYSPIKRQLETLLTTLKGDASLQTKKNAVVLANTAITLMNAAFHAVNLETVTPIKITNNASDLIIAQKGIPFTKVPYTDIGSSDYNAEAIVLTGNDAMTNLQGSLSVLRASDEDAGQALYNSQGERAGRASLVAHKKISALTRKRAMLSNTVPEPSDALSQLELEINKACAYSKECSDLATATINAPVLTNPTEARQCAIADILVIAEHTLQYVDKVRGMFTSRIIP